MLTDLIDWLKKIPPPAVFKIPAKFFKIPTKFFRTLYKKTSFQKTGNCFRHYAVIHCCKSKLAYHLDYIRQMSYSFHIWLTHTSHMEISQSHTGWDKILTPFWCWAFSLVRCIVFASCLPTYHFHQEMISLRSSLFTWNIMSRIL